MSCEVVTCVNTPQLAVVEKELISDYEFARLSSDDRFFHYNSNEKGTVVFYKLFPRKGGRFRLNNFEYVYSPRIPSTIAKKPCVRLEIVVPCDYPTQEPSLDIIRRIQLAAILCQSVVGMSIISPPHHFNDNLENEPAYFEYDSLWPPETAVVPESLRSYSGSSFIRISGPLSEDEDDLFPPVAILKVDKTSAELCGEKNLALYVRERLSLLGQLHPFRLLHLAFVVVDKSSCSTDIFMARQDVCTIKSSVLTYLPASLSEVYSSLVSADAFPSVSRSTRSVLRLVVDKERKTVCARHTRGGVVASLIGSIVHEICHLFKIPHTRYGIMKTEMIA